MTFHVWCPDQEETREDARVDRVSSDAAWAAEREAERRFDYTEPFQDITLMVARDNEEPQRFVVDVEARPEFRARRAR